MVPTPWLDWLLGGLAIAILCSGLWMLFSGVNEIGRKP